MDPQGRQCQHADYSKKFILANHGLREEAFRHEGLSN